MGMEFANRIITRMFLNCNICFIKIHGIHPFATATNARLTTALQILLILFSIYNLQLII